MPYLFSFLPLIVLLSSVFQSPGTYEARGGLSYYEEMPSRYTLEYRMAVGQIDWGADMYIAVADCSHIGKHATVTYDDGREYTAQVFDCSGHDAEPGTAVITSRGIVAELDYASWQAYGLGRATVTINK